MTRSKSKASKRSGAEAGWRPGQCAIGSVKSNIGHALTAAGAAGLLKVLLALEHRTLPPTCEFRARCFASWAWTKARFAFSARLSPGRTPRAGQPRRAAVSGFGFGGINAHVLIEEWDESRRRPSHDELTLRPRLRRRAPRAIAPVAIVGMAAHFGRIEGLARFGRRVLHGETDTVAAPPRGLVGDSGNPLVSSSRSRLH